MISPLTNEKKFGDVSNEDFTTLGVTVVQNSSDIANKPSSSQVDSQIDTKNAAQLQQINLDYADRPTTYNKSEVYTKTESDAALALKGSAAQLATVTAYANTLPTLSTVNNVLNARFLLQDGENFLTFGALSDTTANTTAIATATAATVTNQSGIAAVNANIANILTGSAALETLNVFNEVVGGSNTVEIKNKPDALNVASLQIEHELTTSAQLAKVNFWDTSIPNSSSTSSATALTLSWDGDADTHTSTFAGGLTVAGTMACTNLIVTGIVTMPGGGGASAGDVLKVTRTCFNPHNNVLVPTNGSWVTAITFTHTPSDIQSHLNLTFTAIWKIFTANSGDDGEWLIQIEVDNSAVGGTLLRTIGTSETGSSSPCIGQYTNSSLTAKTITVRARQTGSANDQLMFNNAGTDSTWLHIEEVKR